MNKSHCHEKVDDRPASANVMEEETLQIIRLVIGCSRLQIIRLEIGHSKQSDTLRSPTVVLADVPSNVALH